MAPGYDRIYCTVLRTNAASIHNIEASGFTDWVRPPQELVEEKKRMAARIGRTSDVAYFYLPPGTEAEHARNILGWAKGIDLRREKRGARGQRLSRVRYDHGRLILRTEAVMYYEAALKELSR